jgi:hypothetical protein
MTHRRISNRQNDGQGPSNVLRLPRRVNPRVVLCWLAGQVLALSLLHHLVHIWEWRAGPAILAVVGLGTVFALLLVFTLEHIQGDLGSISPGRWIAFCIPAVFFASVLVPQMLRAPETEHDLTITPMIEKVGAKVQIREIRGAYGNTVNLSGLTPELGWTMSGGLLTANEIGASPLHVHFRGPVGEQVRVSFITSEQGGSVAVRVDGKTARLALLGPDGNETRARLTTRYQFGAVSVALLPGLAVIDGLAILMGLAAIWTLHELGITGMAASRAADRSRVSSHAAGLILVCSLALLLHAWNFVTDPLRVTKDGPSYLQGAVYFAEHGNFDGAASYRGPGTTFLFAPAISTLGRNPLGVKLALHLLAIGCVPLAYVIGWELTKRHWVAVASGLTTALSPDLYAYANDVLSEVPHIFSLLLFAAALLHALRRRSAWSALVCMLAGSLAALMRPDNLVALAFGAVCLCVAALFPTDSQTPGGALDAQWLPRIRPLLLAIVIAAVPLIAWSVHNLRVHGFFGISDYAGEVLYDGWIYYGENSGIKIIDRESSAVQEIDGVLPILSSGGLVPTGWAVHDAMLYQGYTSDQSFSILRQATLDSIRRHPDRALEVLLLKMKEAPIPEATLPVSSAEGNPYAELTSQYFDPEPWLLPWRDEVLARVRELLLRGYGPFYNFWLTVGILSLWLASYRKPPLVWLSYAVLTANALLLPILIGVAAWRYLIPGIILLGPLAFAELDAFILFTSDHFSWRRQFTSAEPQ